MKAEVNKQPDNLVDILPSELSCYQKNHTFNWLSTDDQATFSRNVADADSKDKLRKLGYLESAISYKTDSLGFRNDTVNISDSVLALGCSYTVGIGLHQHETWPYLLSTQIATPVYNAGQDGTGADTAFRIARTLVPEYQPQAVFLLAPFSNRFELNSEFLPLVTTAETNATTTTIGPSCNQKEYGDLSRILFNEEMMMVQQEKNILAIHQICVDHNVPFYCIQVEDIMHLILEQRGARDLLHPGVTVQQQIADLFFEQYSTH
jgi:hypothetical protein